MAGAVPLAAPAAMAAVSVSVSGSLYEALRVGRAATPGEIRAAYRAMAKRLHPDAARAGSGAGAGAAAFVEIRRAYETLSDPAERARYDRSLGARQRRPGVGGGAGTTTPMRVRRWETDQCW
ncbi:hypothetical protein ACP70R_047308 [Stipagrostis hirtigluma subsp. patula]